MAQNAEVKRVKIQLGTTFYRTAYKFVCCYVLFDTHLSVHFAFLTLWVKFKTLIQCLRYDICWLNSQTSCAVDEVIPLQEHQCIIKSLFAHVGQNLNKKKYIHIKLILRKYLSAPRLNQINVAINYFSSLSWLVHYVKYVWNVWLITSPLVLVERVSWRTYRYCDETARYLCSRNLSVNQKNCGYLKFHFIAEN